MSTRLASGAKTSTPKRPAPAYAAASARFFVTDRVFVAGATFTDTWWPSAWDTVARHRWMRLASV